MTVRVNDTVQPWYSDSPGPGHRAELYRMLTVTLAQGPSLWAATDLSSVAWL